MLHFDNRAAHIRFVCCALGFSCALQLLPFDDKLGALIWRRLSANLVRRLGILRRLRRLGSATTSSVLGFRKTIADGTKKIVLRGRACSKTLKDYFVCNSRKAILNPHTPKNEVFAESFWCRFFQKAAVLRRCLFSPMIWVDDMC